MNCKEKCRTAICTYKDNNIVSLVLIPARGHEDITLVSPACPLNNGGYMCFNAMYASVLLMIRDAGYYVERVHEYGAEMFDIEFITLDKYNVHCMVPNRYYININVLNNYGVLL